MAFDAGPVLAGVVRLPAVGIAVLRADEPFTPPGFAAAADAFAPTALVVVALVLLRLATDPRLGASASASASIGSGDAVMASTSASTSAPASAAFSAASAASSAASAAFSAASAAVSAALAAAPAAFAAALAALATVTPAWAPAARPAFAGLTGASAIGSGAESSAAALVSAVVEAASRLTGMVSGSVRFAVPGTRATPTATVAGSSSAKSGPSWNDGVSSAERSRRPFCGLKAGAAVAAAAPRRGTATFGLSSSSASSASRSGRSDPHWSDSRSGRAGPLSGGNQPPTNGTSRTLLASTVPSSMSSVETVICDFGRLLMAAATRRPPLLPAVVRFPRPAACTTASPRAPDLGAGAALAEPATTRAFAPSTTARPEAPADRAFGAPAAADRVFGVLAAADRAFGVLAAADRAFGVLTAAARAPAFPPAPRTGLTRADTAAVRDPAPAFPAARLA